MMKRICISLIVLVLASTAGAELQISVDGDLDPVDSEIIGGNHTLGIWTDADIIPENPYEGYVALVVDTSLATIDYTTGVSGFPDPGIDLEHSMSAATAGFPLPAGEDGILGTIFLTQTSQINAGSMIFDFIDFHSSAYPFDVMIKLYYSQYFATSSLVDSMVVHVPEPMTIALLGLGALFLRKRKA